MQTKKLLLTLFSHNSEHKGNGGARQLDKNVSYCG